MNLFVHPTSPLLNLYFCLTNLILSVFCFPSCQLKQKFLPFPKYIGLTFYFLAPFAICPFFHPDSIFIGWQFIDSLFIFIFIFLSIFMFSFSNPHIDFSISEHVGRSFGFGFKHQSINFLDRELTKPGYGTPWFQISRNISFIYLPSSMVLPVRHSQNITPIAHIYVFSLQMLNLKDYGAIQDGEPTLYSSEGFLWPNIQQYPKSIILGMLLWSIMLAGFISLWTTPFQTKFWQPYKIPFTIQMDL